jgi:hypothetical protein
MLRRLVHKRGHFIRYGKLLARTFSTSYSKDRWPVAIPAQHFRGEVLEYYDTHLTTSNWTCTPETFDTSTQQAVMTATALLREEAGRKSPAADFILVSNSVSTDAAIVQDASNPADHHFHRSLIMFGTSVRLSAWPKISVSQQLEERNQRR